jgi:hypothetical protein
MLRIVVKLTVASATFLSIRRKKCELVIVVFFRCFTPLRSSGMSKCPQPAMAALLFLLGIAGLGFFGGHFPLRLHGQQIHIVRIAFVIFNCVPTLRQLWTIKALLIVIGLVILVT